MKDDSPRGWLSRHVDLIYRVILLALIGLWVAFPPQTSQLASHVAIGTEARR